jgi:uncharacterized metal-binding protein
MTNNCKCECSAAPKLVFSCSGGSDVGELSDRAARDINVKGIGNMYCLAGIGGDVSGIIKTTEAADKIVAIDGCPVNCTKKSLERVGISDFKHIQIADFGIKKGSCQVSFENIDIIVKKAAQLLGEN